MADSSQQHWRAPLTGLVLGAFVSTLATSIVNIAVPTLMDAFGAGPEAVQWVVTIYMLTMGVVIPLAGWLMDRFGQKRLYMASMALFTAGSIACAIAPTLPVLIIARVVQAVGGGLLTPVTMAILYRIVPKEQIGRAMGSWGIAIMAAPAIGPTLGGYFIESMGWPVIFWLNVPAGMLGLYLGARLLPAGDEVTEGSSFDKVGFTTVTLGLFVLQVALANGGRWGWTSPLLVGLLSLSLLSLLLFTWAELRQADPLLDLRVLRYPAFRASIFGVALLVLGLYSGVFYIPIFLQNVLGMTPMQVGLVLMPGAAVSALLQPISGRLYDRVGARVLVVTGMAVMALTNLLFARLSLETAPMTVLLLTALRGAGIGLAYTATLTAGMAAIEPREVGRASSLSHIVQRLAGSLGLAALTVLHTSRIAHHMAAGGSEQAAFVQGLNDMFLVSGVVMLLGMWPAFGLGAAMRGRREHPREDGL